MGGVDELVEIGSRISGAACGAFVVCCGGWLSRNELVAGKGLIICCVAGCNSCSGEASCCMGLDGVGEGEASAGRCEEGTGLGPAARWPVNGNPAACGI